MVFSFCPGIENRLMAIPPVEFVAFIGSANLLQLFLTSASRQVDALLFAVTKIPERSLSLRSMQCNRKRHVVQQGTAYRCSHFK